MSTATRPGWCRVREFRQLDPFLKQVLRSLKGQRAILDGEIVVLDEKGRSNFYDLMAHRGETRRRVPLRARTDRVVAIHGGAPVLRVRE